MNPAFNTPILLLIFNRPAVTQKVFNQIRLINPKYLFIAADGPRPEKHEDILLCQKTREIINQIDWDCEQKILFREENLGCGWAVCSAIDWFFNQVEEGIILEDDCFPDRSFFPYCDELLKKYREDESIFVISGTNLQNGIKRGEGSYYFSNYPITWGWATWRRAWKHFNYEIPHFDQHFLSGHLDHVFQSFSEKRYWRKKIQKSVIEKRSIWDYQWFFSIWVNQGIAIIPNSNLIVNLGFDNLASHNFLLDSVRGPSDSNPLAFPLIHPEKKLDRIADDFTFKNAFSYNPGRLFRLVRENGMISIIKYILAKL